MASATAKVGQDTVTMVVRLPGRPVRGKGDQLRVTVLPEAATGDG
ncbi:hypothetical protein [Streptomyces ferrugineus]|nr:hypothetical protein [Streptomyces ferrugineus]